uniref:Uncharacterized protein n=1 Tax=Candidatus Kentrum sp. FW TaxID=2126338 RepID=A0A450RTG1_9GAMM|nr:MAG: hypothetical protein BECKFW1821A_GA0114235_100177 [Candidatus Kentron sp. FW]
MLKFLEMDKSLLTSTRRDWEEQLNRDPGEFLPGRYLSILDWTTKCVDGVGDHNTYAYAIVDDSKPDSARAILELSHARPNSDSPWLKVLSIHLEPNLDVSENDVDISIMAEISILALRECLGLAFSTHPSDTLKVYAGTPLSLKFLRGLSEPLKDVGINVSTHRNWLVLSGLSRTSISHTD